MLRHVEAPDVPGAHTFGEDREEALLRAPDAIESALMCYVDLRRDIPMPGPGRGVHGGLSRLRHSLQPKTFCNQ